MSFIGVANGFLGLESTRLSRRTIVSSDGTNGSLIHASITAQGINTTLDLITCQAADDWTPTGIEEFVGQWGASNQGFVFRLQGNGTMTLYVSTTGSDLPLATSSAATSGVNGQHLWLRALVDVAASTVTFYTSDDPIDTAPGDVSWTVLGVPDRTFSSSIASGIFASTVAVQVGGRGGLDCFTGKTYRALAYYDGALKWDMNPRNVSLSATSFEATAGETWTLTGSAEFLSI